MTKWKSVINAASMLCTGCVVLGLTAYTIMDYREWERWSVFLDKYPISAYELPPPLDLEIPLVFGWRQTGDIELLRVRPEKIGPQHFRDPAIETQNHWEPGGWIADDLPIIKGESVHPKGGKFAATGEPDPEGGYRPRPEFKLYTQTEGVGKVTSATETRGDRE